MGNAFDLDQTFTHKSTTHEFTIRWTRIGSPTSPPLIFIHGTPWSSTIWHNLATSLSSRYDIYVYDHPGFGVSPFPTRLANTKSPPDDPDTRKTDLDPSLTLRASATAALIAHWNLPSPPHILAHDNGGLVALRLLLEHRIAFRCLCLIDVVALPHSGLPFFKLVADNEAVFNAIPENLLEGFVRAYVKSATFSPLPEDVEDMLCEPWLRGGVQEGMFLREMVQAHYREVGVLLEGYTSVGEKTPTKIIWGADDKWIPAETAGRLQEALNAEEMAIIEEAGHLVQYDQAGRLALEVGLWLAKHDEMRS